MRNHLVSSLLSSSYSPGSVGPCTVPTWVQEAVLSYYEVHSITLCSNCTVLLYGTVLHSPIYQVSHLSIYELDTRHSLALPRIPGMLLFGRQNLTGRIQPSFNPVRREVQGGVGRLTASRVLVD